MRLPMDKATAILKVMAEGSQAEIVKGLLEKEMKKREKEMADAIEVHRKYRATQC